MTERPRNIVILLAILLTAAALRLYNIHRETAWNDEALSLRFLDAPTWRAYAEPLFREDHAVRHVPVYFAAQYGWSRVFGPSVLSLRMMSFTCAMISIGLLYGTAKRLASERAALIAAGLFAVSLPHIYYAQEVRFYAFATLLVLASNYAFVRLVQNGDKRWWTALLLADAAMTWTHTFAPLIWLAQGAYLLLFHRGSARVVAAWFAAHAVIVATFGIWLWSLDYAVIEDYVKQSTPTWRELLNAFNVYAGGRFEKVDPAVYLPAGVSFDHVLTLLLLAFAGLACVKAYQRRASDEARFEAVTFAMLWSLVPPLFLFAVSQVWKPVFLFRYTLYSSLALYLLAAIGFDALPTRRYRIATAAVLAILFAHQLTVRLQAFRPDYRAADVIVFEHGTAADQVLVLKALNGVPYRFNSELPPQRIEVFDGLGELYDEAIRRVRNGEQVWLIAWQFEPAQIESLLLSEDLAVERKELPGIPPLYLYRLTEKPVFAEGVAAGMMPPHRDHPLGQETS